MKKWILIAVSTLLLSAQERHIKQYRQPNGTLVGTIECTEQECKAYDVDRHLLGIYNKLTHETRYPNGKLLGKFNALPALVYCEPCKAKSR
jgi:hypothetical protein